MARPSYSLQSLYGPQGDGWHTCISGSGTIRLSSSSSRQTNKQTKIIQLLITRSIDEMKKKKKKTYTHTLWNFIATNGGISCVSTRATAIWCMICNKTFSICATHSNTWIDTFHINAGFSHWTITVHYTFGTTFNIWITKIFGQTSARSGVIFFLANCIYSAWICLTSRYFGLMIDYKNQILWTRINCCWTDRNRKFQVFVNLKYTWNWRAGNKRITSVSVWTTTSCLMIVTTANSFWSTTTNTWINTTLIYASQISWTFRIRHTFRSTIWWTTKIVW